MKKNNLTVKMLLLIFVLQITSLNSNGQTLKGNWTMKSSMLTARWYPATCVFNGKIYVNGGNKSSTTAPLSVLEVYDPVTDTWETKSPSLTPRSQASACELKGKIYVIGGSVGPSTWKAVSTVEIYNPATDTWSKGKDLPTPRVELGLVTLNDKIYAIGGFTKAVEIYDPVTNTWTKGADMPSARGTMPACALDGKIYVPGGCLTGYAPLATLEVYDPISDTWTTKTGMPSKRSHLNGCVLNNRVFAIGGSNVNGGVSYTTVESYDPKTDTWQTEPSMPTIKEALGVVELNGKIYTIGGTSMQKNLNAFNSVEVYDPFPKITISNPEIRLPVAASNLIGTVNVENNEDIKFKYILKNESDAGLFQINGNSLTARQNIGLDAKKNYQINVTAISEKNDTVNSVIYFHTYFKVDVIYSTPNGFLLQSSSKKVMVDVLSAKANSLGFQVNSEAIRENMKNGVEPFNNIDLIYTSHEHACHFDAELLQNVMKNNPKAIAVMGQTAKKSMIRYFTDNPGLENRIFCPEIPAISYIDTTIAGIKIRLSNLPHGSSPTLALNIMLDSIQFVHYDDRNNLTASNYNTIGFTNLPVDVALLGAQLLDGNQLVIKDKYSTRSLITVSHVGNVLTSYDTYVTKANILQTLGYKVNMPRWPMEMFSYKKINGKVTLDSLNSAPQLKLKFNDVNFDKGVKSTVYIYNTSFLELDANDKIDYSWLINDEPLPDWAIYDAQEMKLDLIPPDAKTYTITITATDSHLSFASTTFKLIPKITSSVKSIENQSNFRTYPNPAQSVLYIEKQKNHIDRISVSAYNLLGKKVYYDQNLKQDKTAIDLTKFDENIMLLLISDGTSTECHKIVRCK